MPNEKQPIEVGDQFQDLDKRAPGPRVVKVEEAFFNANHAYVTNVEHWNEKLIGRWSSISHRRLLDPRLFKRVSR